MFEKAVDSASTWIHRRFGGRAWRLVRAVYRAARPGHRATAPGSGTPDAGRAAESGVDISYPPDVADVEALRAYLLDTDIFGDRRADCEVYVNDSLERFRVTMALLPDLEPGARVLELGANPYFLTRLLRRRGLDVTCANYYTETTPPKGREESRGSGAHHVFDFDHFNVERDRFPYDDGAFDLVLCCEILEHLPFDPTHMLVEIHRVLRDGGHLLLTTPNPVRWDNVVRVTTGENPYEALSGYGVYGRHNREYTLKELEDLLTDVGFGVERLLARDCRPPPPGVDEVPPGISTENRGDNLFVVARAVGEPTWAYPTWLYQSAHKYPRASQPDHDHARR